MLTGDLGEFSATDLLGLVAAAGATGALVLEGPGVACVHCADGAVTHAATRAEVTLADVLVSTRFLEAAQWAEAARADDPATAVAKALAANGADPVRLASVLQGRTEEAVFELDLWRHGSFRFEPGADHLLGDAFRFAISDVLAAVADRRRRWDGLVARFGSLDHVIAPEATDLQGDADDEVVLNRAQFRVLAAAARHLPVADLARELDLGLFATGGLVAGLVDQGLLCVLDPAAERPPMPARTPAAPAGGGITFEHHAVAPIGELDVPVLEPVGVMSLVGAPAGGGPVHSNGAEFVAPGDAPARDLILRLLTAVKEL